MIRVREDSRPYLLPALLGLIALAWAALLLWGNSPYGRYLDHDRFGAVDLRLDAELAVTMSVFVAGWTLMTVAMMLPTSLPLVTMFRRMVSRRRDGAWLLALLIAGYLAVWSLFGLGVHAADAGLHAGIERWHWLDDRAWVLGGGTLVLAGLYQFTPLKYMCLDKCRSPFSFIAEHWRGSGERSQAFALGLHHGLFCVGCCWSLMLLMFAVGTGSVAWMLALGTVMAVEKNVSWGKRLVLPLGGLLVAAGLTVLLFTAPEACAHSGPCG